MLNFSQNTFRQTASAIAHDPDSASLLSHIEASDTAISLRVPVLGSSVAIRITASANQSFLVGVYGLTGEATQWLNEVIVVQTEVVVTEDAKLLQVYSRSDKLSEVKKESLKLARLLLSLRTQEESGQYAQEVTAPMYWASETFNFGDWIGPHLVSAYTGRQPVHIRRFRRGNPRVLFSVGSILGVLRRNDVDVWGSGLIRALNVEEIKAKKALRGIRVHAVRGVLTQNILQEQLGWEVPDVYGDPALLLPEILPMEGLVDHSVTCIPHYVHQNAMRSAPSNVIVSDVRTDISNIAKQVASAEVVISSSLHGLILAQAYGKPWVRLRVTDRPLTGGDFKFDDFYSCLDSGAVSTVETTLEKLPEMDLIGIASEASLPDTRVDLSALRDSLPLKVSSKPHFQPSNQYWA